MRKGVALIGVFVLLASAAVAWADVAPILRVLTGQRRVGNPFSDATAFKNAVAKLHIVPGKDGESARLTIPRPILAQLRTVERGWLIPLDWGRLRLPLLTALASGLVLAIGALALRHRVPVGLRPAAVLLGVVLVGGLFVALAPAQTADAPAPEAVDLRSHPLLKAMDAKVVVEVVDSGDAITLTISRSELARLRVTSEPQPPR
jgi:hypothetical protein